MAIYFRSQLLVVELCTSQNKEEGMENVYVDFMEFVSISNYKIPHSWFFFHLYWKMNNLLWQVVGHGKMSNWYVFHNIEWFTIHVGLVFTDVWWSLNGLDLLRTLHIKVESQSQ